MTRRIPRTPTFCRLRPEDAKCRSTSSRVCAGVSKRTATLKITATKRRISSLREAVRDPAPTTVLMVSPPACLSARSAGAPAGRQKKKIEARPPKRRGAELMGSGREKINKRGRTQLNQPKRSTQTHKERKLKEADHFSGKKVHPFSCAFYF